MACNYSIDIFLKYQLNWFSAFLFLIQKVFEEGKYKQCKEIEKDEAI